MEAPPLNGKISIKRFRSICFLFSLVKWNHKLFVCKISKMINGRIINSVDPNQTAPLGGW